jgi:hypothetical protein
VSREADASDGFLGQRREAGSHRLGRKVPGTGNIKKVKIDEVSC